MAKNKLVVVGGAYEFQSLQDNRSRPADLAVALSKAYSLLPYDLGYLTASETAWLESHGAKAPSGWRITGSSPQTVYIRKGDLKIAFIIFPSLNGKSNRPSPETLRRVIEAAHRIKSGTDLLVGLSPWGEDAESAFLMKKQAMFDFLLGSGTRVTPGIRQAAGDKTLWVHPEFYGRSLQQIEILAKIESRVGWKWQEGVNFRHRTVELGDNIPSEPEISRLFIGLEEVYEEEP